jgi:hypothetical protein
MKKINVVNGKIGEIQKFSPIDLKEFHNWGFYAQYVAGNTSNPVIRMLHQYPSSEKYRWIFARCIQDSPETYHHSIEDAIKWAVENGYKVVVVPTIENPLNKLFE